MNIDVISLIGHGLLGRALQSSGLLRFRAQRLDGIHDIRLLVIIRVSHLGRPRKILVHIGQHRWKLRQRLDARIPILLINFSRELLAL